VVVEHNNASKNKMLLNETITKTEINKKSKEVRRLNTHSGVMTSDRHLFGGLVSHYLGGASHNYILSEIEASKKCNPYKDNNDVGVSYHIFFCLNFG